jgi:hypothetical protein
MRLPLAEGGVGGAARRQGGAAVVVDHGLRVEGEGEREWLQKDKEEPGHGCARHQDVHIVYFLTFKNLEGPRSGSAYLYAHVLLAKIGCTGLLTFSGRDQVFRNP